MKQYLHIIIVPKQMRYLTLMIVLSIGITVQAQLVEHLSLLPDTAARFRFEMRDGSIVYGNLIAADSFSLTVETLQLGTVIMQKGSIREVRRVDMLHFSRQRYRHPMPHEYFVTPSAHMLEKRTSQYRTLYLVSHSGEAGITDHLTAGGGFIFFSPFSSWNDPSFFLKAKAGHRMAKNLRVAGNGMLLVTLPSRSIELGSRRITESMLSGVITYGDTDHHVSLGGGRFLRHGDVRDLHFLSLAGSARMSRALSLISENWLLMEDLRKVLSFGMRLHGPNVSFDLAMIAEFDRPGYMRTFPFLGLGVRL